MGSNALDEAYLAIKKRVEQQRPVFKDLAKRAVAWITHGQRLLTVTEVKYALAIELEELEINEDNLNDIEDILSVSAGLVIIDQETETMMSVHYTTQGYFARTGIHCFPYA